MSDFLEMLFDVVIEFFMNLAEDKPGRASWVRITASVLGLLAMLAFFVCMLARRQ